MLADLRFTLRSLRKSPALAVVAILSLALGIGANTAVFSLFDQVLVRSLPVADPARLVLFHGEGQDPGWAMADNYETVYSYPNYLQFRDRSQVFDGVAARAGSWATVMEPAGAAHAGVELVSGNFFQVLGVRAALGRTILPSDDTVPGAHPVVMLSYGYWNRRFGSDPKVLNGSLRVNGYPMMVIGVLDRRFLGVQSGQMPELYVPLTMKQQISPGWDAFHDVSGRWLNLVARLKPGVSRETAQAATRVLFKAIRNEDLPRIRPMPAREQADYMRRTVDLRPAAQGINMLSEFWRTPLKVLMGMVGLVLLIACANLANLLMARAAARQKEMAVRAALGAGRLAVLRQLLTESLTLTLAAGLVGLVLARWADAGLTRLLDETGEPGWVTAQLDWRLFAYAMAVAAAAGLVFGCAPLLQIWRIDLVTALKEQGTTASVARQRTRKMLVAMQVALALVLLTAAGLFARTLLNLKQTNPGFQPANLLTFTIEPRLCGYDKARGEAMLENLGRRLASLAGVESVAYAAMGPFSNAQMGGSLYVEGYRAAADEEPDAARDTVSAGYFRALRIPMLAGREFNERDTAAGPKVAIINEALAKKYFRGRSPLGLHIGTDKKMEYEIVGVARDVHGNSLRQAVEPFVYLSHAQDMPDRSTVYVRGYGRDLAATARAAVRQIDANMPLTNMKTMQARIDESMFVERSVAVLAAAFGLLATVLAAVGLYGVIAYSVARRRVEIGVRMALGAARADVYRLVLREVSVLVAAGAVVGIPAALGLGRLVESQLFGVRSHDPLMMGAAVLSLAVVALAAGLVPARRAASVDPVRALRGE